MYHITNEMTHLQKCKQSNTDETECPADVVDGDVSLCLLDDDRSDDGERRNGQSKGKNHDTCAYRRCTEASSEVAGKHVDDSHADDAVKKGREIGALCRV